MVNLRLQFAALAAGLMLLTPGAPKVHAQALVAAGSVVPLRAVLVLTPEFCATEFKQGSVFTTGRETFKVGQMACQELGPALKPAFTSLTVAAEAPASSDAQVFLIPKFANGHATTATFAFSNREMDVLLEWTAKDASGKTVWLQTVQGTSKHHMGNMFTHGHDVKLIAADSVKDAAAQSVTSMEGAAELRKLSAQNETAAK